MARVEVVGMNLVKDLIEQISDEKIPLSGILLTTLPLARSTTATSLGIANATKAILLLHNPMPKGVVVLLSTDRSIFFVSVSTPDLSILPIYRFFFAPVK